MPVIPITQCEFGRWGVLTYATAHHRGGNPECFCFTLIHSQLFRHKSQLFIWLTLFKYCPTDMAMYNVQALKRKHTALVTVFTSVFTLLGKLWLLPTYVFPSPLVSSVNISNLLVFCLSALSF